MTDQEIIKALRICADGYCDSCAYVSWVRCQRKLLNDAADRLEELTASQHVMTIREENNEP